MADRIVQLIDENDNNIYPVASVANAANITMTDTDPGEGSPLAAGNYIAVYGQNGYIETADIADEAITADKTNFGGNYSTTEVDTGFTWIDGRHIYKKTVNTGTLPNASTKNVPHAIGRLRRVLALTGWGFKATDNTHFQLPFVTLTAAGNIQTYVSGSSIVIATDSDRSSITESYITLYYTKTS